MLELELVAVQIVLNTTDKSLAQQSKGEKNGSRKNSSSPDRIQICNEGDIGPVCDNIILEGAY